MNKRVLVLGDRIVDEYMHCRATRLCPEAPAPVLVESERRKACEGGASLVSENLKSLLCPDGCWGHIVYETYGSDSHKLRIFADRTLICRVDNDSFLVKQRIDYLSQIRISLLKGISAVVVGDYGKGAMTPELAAILTGDCIGQGIPLFVDAKSDPAPYKGCFAIFPNEHEHQDINSKEYMHVIRKLGPRGCSVDGILIPTEEQQVYDVTGAGDVFLAAFVAKYLQTSGVEMSQAYRLEVCAKYANKAAGISVRHLGTYIVKPEELEK